MRYLCLSELNPELTASLKGGLSESVFRLMDTAVARNKAPAAQELTAAGLDGELAALLAAHLAYVMGLKREGRQPYGGPCADFSGAINIYEADSDAEAVALHDADPFCQAGLFRLTRCIPWRQVLV